MRLRLTRSEVDALHDRGEVIASTGFPGGRTLQYRVANSPGNTGPAAQFSADTITVSLPEAAVIAWATTEQVSLQGAQTLDDGEQLQILVEKDFVCLTSREGEDESDMYPHPEADRISC